MLDFRNLENGLCSICIYVDCILPTGLFSKSSTLHSLVTVNNVVGFFFSVMIFLFFYYRYPN